jgi:hypothetical protein
MIDLFGINWPRRMVDRSGIAGPVACLMSHLFERADEMRAAGDAKSARSYERDARRLLRLKLEN